MKKISLVLIGVLAFATIVTYIRAQENNPNRTAFSEHLTGTFTLGTSSQHGQWTDMTREMITGNGEGNLAESAITFTIQANRRFKIDDGKSFINGTWKFVSADESSISGIFMGNGISANEFSGKFMTNQSQKSTASFVSVKIQGDFSCVFSPLPPYGNLWKYEAWLDGVIQEVED